MKQPWVWVGVSQCIYKVQLDIKVSNIVAITDWWLLVTIIVIKFWLIHKFKLSNVIINTFYTERLQVFVDMFACMQ